MNNRFRCISFQISPGFVITRSLTSLHYRAGCSCCPKWWRETFRFYIANRDGSTSSQSPYIIIMCSYFTCSYSSGLYFALIHSRVKLSSKQIKARLALSSGANSPVIDSDCNFLRKLKSYMDENCRAIFFNLSYKGSARGWRGCYPNQDFILGMVPFQDETKFYNKREIYTWKVLIIKCCTLPLDATWISIGWGWKSGGVQFERSEFPTPPLPISAWD